MADEMINKTKPYNRSSGIQGIGDTVKLYEQWNMNEMNDAIEKASKNDQKIVEKHSKNS